MIDTIEKLRDSVAQRVSEFADAVVLWAAVENVASAEEIEAVEFPNTVKDGILSHVEFRIKATNKIIAAMQVHFVQDGENSKLVFKETVPPTFRKIPKV